jgi:hypothetical protein
MKARRLLALSILAIVFGCEGHQSPTAPRVTIDPSKIISDGAHGPGGNPDFFFLPPLVPLPLNNPNFVLGKFNNALQLSLVVEICELIPEPSNALPTLTTGCITVAPAGTPLPLKTFGAGTVKLVNLPLRQWGWWSLFGLPADGFYYVLWDTRQSHLDVNKYYRIKVFMDGDPDHPLGIADVDPMSSLREWRYTRTGQVIQLVNGWLLPIPFRVQKGAFCEGAELCTSATVTNNNPNAQIVQVQGNNGPIAGVKIPAGKWLPDGGPQSVVLTIAQVNTGANNLAAGTQANPCHPVTLQQFNGCFHFSTIPKLARINPEDPLSDQFLKKITVAVCFVLADRVPLDARYPWTQLWSSDVDESPHPLPSAYAGDILSVHSEENCGSNYVAVNNSGGLTGLASAGWRTLKGGLGRFFGVKTAYAVDLGLGGLAGGISNIGPALTAQIFPAASTAYSELGGTFITAKVKIVGTQSHGDPPSLLTVESPGIPGLPVTFTLPSASDGTLTNADAFTNSTGFASVTWQLPYDARPSTLTVNSTQATGGPVTFTAATNGLGLNVLAGSWVNQDPATPDITRLSIGVDGSAVSVHAWGKCDPTDCDWGLTSGNTDAWVSSKQITAIWIQSFAIRNQTLTYLEDGRLLVTTDTHFTDGSKRPDYRMTDYFIKL